MSREDAEADIRKRRFDPERRNAFQRWVDRIVSAYEVQRNEALLEKVQVDSLIGLK